jgi:hypothetical protein
MRRTHLCLDGDKEEVETLPMILQVRPTLMSSTVLRYANYLMAI